MKSGISSEVQRVAVTNIRNYLFYKTVKSFISLRTIGDIIIIINVDLHQTFGIWTTGYFLFERYNWPDSNLVLRLTFTKWEALHLNKVGQYWKLSFKVVSFLVGGIIVLLFFENDQGAAVTAMVNEFLFLKIKIDDMDDIWFQ